MRTGVVIPDLVESENSFYGVFRKIDMSRASCLSVFTYSKYQSEPKLLRVKFLRPYLTSLYARFSIS